MRLPPCRRFPTDPLQQVALFAADMTPSLVR